MDPFTLGLTILGLLLGVAALPWVAPFVERRRRRRAISKGRIPEKILAGMSEVDVLAQRRLYFYGDGDGWVSAIRLVGAGSEIVPVARLQVSYEHTPFVTPPELHELRTLILARRIEEAEKHGKVLFDGPNTRLMEWRGSPRGGLRAGLEETWLELRLGPVGWFDFEGLNAAFQDSHDKHNLASAYEYYVGLSWLLTNGSPARSKLSNILDNAVTIVTNDGYVGYQQRSARVSTAAGMLTSSVAENTNRFLDDSDPSDALLLHNPLDLENSSTLAPTGYQPRGVPHPVAAVRRGIGFETSPRILEALELTDIYVTGLSFDLAGLHPDLLLAVFLDMPHDRALACCHEYPGKEFIEGTLHFVPASFEHPDTKRILAQPEWVPAGKASLIRALEVLTETSRESRLDFDAIFSSFHRPK